MTTYTQRLSVSLKASCTMGYEGFYTQSSNMASKYYNFVTLNKMYINFGLSAQL